MENQIEKQTEKELETVTAEPALFEKTLVKKINALDFLDVCSSTAPSS